MLNLVNQKVLILAPHVDDAVLACGGTIALLEEQSCEIHHACFSWSTKSIPEGFPRDSTRQELTNALETLGIKSDNSVHYEYETRCFSESRQNILEDLYLLNRELSPSIVLLPSISDMHQDHQVICQEGMRIFRTKTILGYELPHNIREFPTGCFIGLKERHLKRKSQAWNCFKSQHPKRPYPFIENLPPLRGEQVSKEYAECFEVIRLVP